MRYIASDGLLCIKWHHVVESLCLEIPLAHTLDRMAKKKPTAKDADAVPTTFRFRAIVRKALEQYIASRPSTNVTHEIHEALMERLELLGYWPPKP